MSRTLVALKIALLCMGLVAGCETTPPLPPAAPNVRTTIVLPAAASACERLAAQEVRRYVYLRTGTLLTIEVASARAALPADGSNVIAVARDRGADLWPEVRSLRHAGAGAKVARLEPGEYLLCGGAVGDRRVLALIGGDETGVLYAAYRFAEHLGVRFYLEGDVLPDERIPLSIPDLDEHGKPLFALRGIQPFHDFAEGPDWWDTDDYLAIIAQLPKLRMNFIGLHTYPEGGVGPEPTVWIGPPGEVETDGKVKASYPSSYHNVLRGTWGYKPKATGKFAFGAAQLFDRDAYGPAVMGEAMPVPKDATANNEVFDRTAGLLRTAFESAHQLGIKTCVGTETPLTIPRLVKERLKLDPKAKPGAEAVQQLYEGMFTRIARSYPLDYYWFWTPEDWTWSGVKPEQVQATLDDLQCAMTAAKAVHAPFTLATCGWVLGPQNDRARFDNFLPKDLPMSCINRQVGNEPVDPGFAKVTGRPKWAIPWLEDDPGLTQPQLWVGRMRRDARDALQYGCTGLMGIHWRTRSVGPMVSALAQAAWDQSAWANVPAKQPALPDHSFVIGGQASPVYPAPVAGTDEGPLYQKVRYNLAAYRLKVPNGAYRVTLKFSEPHYDKAGARVFGVKVQGQQVLDNFDIFAKVGRAKALDCTYPDVKVTDGWLRIEFVPIVEFPAIAALVVEGPRAGATVKINCGGPAYKDYAADLPVVDATDTKTPPCGDFYRDWVRQQFNPPAEVRDLIAGIFERVDGHLPPTCTWIDGPGGIAPDPRPWEQVAPLYAFVGELEAFRPFIRGDGYVARYDYWLETFRYMRAIAHLKCTWHPFSEAMKKLAAEKEPAKAKELAGAALPLRKQIVADTAEVYRHLLAAASTPGELGTVANWEEHVLPRLLDEPGAKLAAALGTDLPADAQPTTAYVGPLRIIVPTVRSSATAGEALPLKVILLAGAKITQATLHVRPLGRGEYTTAPLEPVARGVYRVQFPPAQETFEYYLTATTEDRQQARYPATAPRLNQTVVLTPK